VYVLFIQNQTLHRERECLVRVLEWCPRDKWYGTKKRSVTIPATTESVHDGSLGPHHLLEILSSAEKNPMCWNPNSTSSITFGTIVEHEETMPKQQDELDDENCTLQNLTHVTSVTDIIPEMFE
jgi:hypothetical protein